MDEPYFDSWNYIINCNDFPYAVDRILYHNSL